MRWTCWAQQTKARNADGEVVWSCCLDAGINPAMMLRITPGTETQSPISGESTKEAVKTIRAGNAGTYPGEPVANACVFFFHASLWGRWRARHSLRPLMSEGHDIGQQPRVRQRRGMKSCAQLKVVIPGHAKREPGIHGAARTR